MQEQHPYPEQNETPLMVAPIEAAVKQLQKDAVFVPLTEAEAHTTELSYTTYVGSRQQNGSYAWNRHFKETPPENAIAVNPSAHAEDKPIFDYAVAQARSDESFMKALAKHEGYWWDSSKSKELVTSNLKEAFRINEGTRHMDLLNCSDDALTEAERASVEKTFNAVANFTGSKIFSRVKGVIFAPGSEFEGEVAGDIQAAAGVIRMNMDVLRKKDSLGRYKEYFADDEVNWFEVVLAHELGHAMDISSIDEADSHGISKDTVEWLGMFGMTRDFSAFQAIDEWQAHKKDGKNHWMIDELAETECRDYAPTNYSLNSPHEDFAETFAITALGGDVSQLPRRSEIISKTMQLAEGRSLIGPKKVELTKLDGEEGYPPKQATEVGLVVYLRD